MRHRTVAATRSVFAGFLAIAMIAGFSPASAQIGPVYTACQGPNCPVGSFDDLQEAIDEATDAGATGNQALVLVYGGTTWVENLIIEADANIRILGVPLDAQQIIALIDTDGGDFTLTFRDPLTDTDETTAAIPFDATAADVQAELEALTTIDPGDVIVTGPDGGPYEVQFGGNFVGVRMNLLVANNNLTNTGPEEPFIIVESLEGPQNVVIDGSGSGIVIEVVAEPDMDEADRLIVEGITIQNGSDGVQLVDLDGEDVPFSPTFNRCYIRDNTDNGVRVQGDGDPLLVNCSISENGQSGVFVGDGSGVGSGAFADILHCSIIDNEERGIYVETAGNSARVRNTLVFRNGSGAATQGGVIWEINPFIEPSVGPVEGGTPVTITGLDFGAAPVVYFGPPDKPDTIALNITVNGAGTQITCETPPAWTGAPGPVDVYIERADGFVIRVPNGFTYQAAAAVDPIPIVTRVSPGWGPVDNASTTGIDESAIDVYVYGANFDPDCEVWFDFNGNEAINAGIDGQSPRVRWINSGLLLARVPTRATPTTPPVIDVLVRNVPSGRDSLAGPLKDYEYRNVTALAPQIDSIVPSRSTELDGGGVTAEIIGANFDPDCVVLIGGILCTYGSVDVSGQVIRSVIVPVSQFGGGGSYDVTVINPDGTWDVLPRGFTYFPTGEPGTDAGTDVWRVANFVERTAGGVRSIFGHGFDFNVDLETGGTAFATNVQPIAQREIPFTYPANTDGLGLAAGVSAVPIDVMNVGTQQGGPSTQPLASTTLVYAEQRAIAPGAGQALYFEIGSVTAALNPGNPDDISVQILNYQTEMSIYVGDVLVNPADYSAPAPPSAAIGASATVTFPAPAQPNGVWGPVDVRVELPDTSALNGTGELLYYVAENAYSYRRADQAPEAYSVTPNTVPDNDDNGPVSVLISGANFVGPSGAGVYTRVLLDPDTTDDNGNEIDLSAVTGTYSVISFNSITFAIDLDTVDPTFPRNTPVDLVLEQYDATAGTVLVSGGNPLRSRLSGAIRFEDATAPPQITSVANQTDLTATGPVSGYDAVGNTDFLVDITGSGFSTGGVVEPIVLFGTAQAEVQSFSPGAITVELPPAPNGLPGIYDVTVIRPDDQISGSLVGGFTYYMDGAPYINEIVPNHMASDEAGPYFVTIRGYNFDDLVDVRFNGPSGDITISDVRSISPYEIVVVAPDPASLATDPGDYPTGIATVPVTVQNRTDLDATQAGSQGFVSNAVEFYLHNDRENLTANIPELLYNDVYDNNQFDYLNVSPGTGSISIDPALLPDAPWLGKLIVDTDDAPLLNTAGPFTVDPHTITDFEGDVRPTGDGAEIGADEIRDLLDGDSIDQAVWIFARPTPNPVGKMDADELLVELIFTANIVTDDTEVFIGPQGGIPADPAHRIPLELFEQIGRGHYLFRNPEPIETLVVDNTPSGLGQGDIVADGHAAIYVEDLVNFPPGREILGYTGDPVTSLDHGGFIQSQAINGRHFLIDTVPPRIYVEIYESAIGDYLNALDIFPNPPPVSHDDEMVSGNANPASHPPPSFPLPPTGVTVELPTTWSPATLPAPVDYNGALTLPPLAGVDGTKIFFNNGSLAQDSGVSPVGSPLNFVAVVTFIDKPPTEGLDPRAPEINGSATDQDFFSLSPSTNRQVAGFLPEVVDDPVSDSLDTGEARWILGADSVIFSGVPATGNFSTFDAGVPNPGVFDPNLYPFDSVPDPSTPTNSPNHGLSAAWTVGPIPALTIPLDHIHGEGVMVATDLAGNSTEDITAFLTDPLHVWWIIDVHSEIFPDLPDGFATKRPYFTMELDRSFNPQPAGGPPPIFTYRIYASPDFCGDYEVRSPWRPWSPNKSIDDIPNYVTEGEWVLLVVIGADEAGNVEKWPLPGSPVDGPIDLCTATPIPGARNWKRFLFTGFDAPETVIDPTFWHDVNDNNNIDNEPNFGSSRLIPLPDDIGIPVRAEFLVSAIRPPGQSAPIRIQWQLIEDGVLADQFIDATTTPGSFDLGVYTANGQVRRITAPVDIATLTGQPGLGDVPFRQRPITYVYRAAAYFDDNLDTTPDPTDNNGVFDPSAGEIMDPTPANVYFTVVPTGVSNYIKAPTDDDSQPIKEQEIR